ncbi:MAG: MFS transporter [Limisphaera sp.]|nr:MFS transporter [Limisphaera sp.]
MNPPSPLASPSSSVGPQEDRRSFICLWIAQFQGAFSDNLHKFLVLYLALGMGLSQAREQAFVPLVNALFAVPFLVFSMLGGWLADRFSKRTVCVGVKVAEIGVMLLATAALSWVSIPLMLVAVFLMSTQSALFGPTKYGLLPELLPESRLSWGNGWLGLGTFLAIILGTMAAGGLMSLWGTHQAASGWLLVGLATVGTVASLGIRRLPAAAPERPLQWNPWSEFFQQWRWLRKDRVLLSCVLAVDYLWFLGALLQPALIFYCRDVLRGTEWHTSLLQAGLALGIGLGSAAAGYVSGRRIELALVPVGALGLAALGAVLGMSDLSFYGAVAAVGGLGFAGGLYVVPLNALLQARPVPERRGGVLAVSALLSWAGIVLAGGPLYYVLTAGLGLGPRGVFLVGATLSFAGLAAFVWAMPESFIRLAEKILVHTLHPVHVLGRANVPQTGGALLASNHQSLVDWMLLRAAVGRPIRFLMYHGHYEQPWLKFWARALGVIPVAPQLGPRALRASLEQARAAIRAGELVCIFPEGQMTRTGHLLPFRRGLEKIMEGLDAPILPVALEGVWGSPFSFQRRRTEVKWPRRLLQPVTIVFGRPLPGHATAFQVRLAVQEAWAEAWQWRFRHGSSLSQRFLARARRHPWRLAMADERSGSLSCARVVTGAVLVARRLRRHWGSQERVGVLLPPCVPAALVHWALVLAGKVPVHLNYTLAADTLAACVQQAGLRFVISSERFLQKMPVQLSVPVVCLESVLAGIRPWEKMLAAVAAWFFPARMLERWLGGKPVLPRTSTATRRMATLVFSSGSTGEPKAAVLSQANILANIEQVARVIALDRNDRLLGILPFFHSFGFTVGLTLPALLGVPVVFHPNPVDARAIGELVRRWQLTLLIATPTFLQFYLRGVNPADFQTLRLVVTGAEKLPARLARAFTEAFGVQPLEGYGCTECGPVVSVNVPDFQAPGFHQVGHKPGSVGLPLPGVAVRVVDPGSFEPLPANQPGLLLVRGPNVMEGYWKRPDLTAAAFRDGWYVTADIARLDEDGFVYLTDRLARFSKIGGEMVPHLRVEEVLHELAGATERCFVVTSVPDESRGERLVVLHRLEESRLRACLQELATTQALPNLWKPRPDQFYRVEAFPLLGSGKLDLCAVRQLARQLAGAVATTVESGP